MSSSCGPTFTLYCKSPIILFGDIHDLSQCGGIQSLLARWSMVVNHVLLATTWYMNSCSFHTKSHNFQLRWLLYNFGFTTNEKKNTRSMIWKQENYIFNTPSLLPSSMIFEFWTSWSSLIFRIWWFGLYIELFPISNITEHLLCKLQSVSR